MTAPHPTIVERLIAAVRALPPRDADGLTGHERTAVAEVLIRAGTTGRVKDGRLYVTPEGFAALRALANAEDEWRPTSLYGIPVIVGEPE